MKYFPDFVLFEGWISIAWSQSGQSKDFDMFNLYGFLYSARYRGIDLSPDTSGRCEIVRCRACLGWICRTLHVHSHEIRLDR